MITAIAATGTPAFATYHTCRIAKACVQVNGAGSRVDSASAWLDNNAWPDVDFGHLQVRWHAGGVDHFKDAPNAVINTAGARSSVSLGVVVDAHTYVCG